jgi:penicillin-binding protein 2
MNDSQTSHRELVSQRPRVFYLLIILIFGYYTIRLFNLQIVHGTEYLAKADDNRTETISLPAQRGVIYDRNSYVLARNVPSYNITITPASLPGDEGTTQEIYRQLSALIDIPVSNGEINEESVKLFKPCETDLGITQVVYIADTNAPYDPISIKCDVDETTALTVMEKAKDWPGVSVQVNAVREYPTGWLTSEIIGFLGPIPASLEEEYTAQGYIPGRDKVGYAGVEYSLQDILGGKNGEREVEVDVAGQVLRDLESPIEPVPGNSVELTIDTRLQMAAKTALIEEITYWNKWFNEIRSSNGVVIAINPKTGEILALVSYPTFENNRMARVIPAYYYEQLTSDPNRPLFNHAISAELPPGSVYKMATAIGVLNEGVMTPTDTIEDLGKISVLQKFSPNDPGTPRDYVCWEPTGHGIVDFVHAVAWSCDVYFYKVSGGYKDEVPQGLGIWRMDEYARALGYGEATGIELPGEASGLVPDPDWKRITQGENWATGDTYIAAMGQGYVLATPLQVLMSFATLANDGKMMQPTLVHDVLDAQGNVIQPFEPKLKHDITQEPLIQVYDETDYTTGEMKVVEPWVIEKAKEGMRLVTLPGGTAYSAFEESSVQAAGKTGTAEYCDDIASKKGLCRPENWPAHAWFVGYAPYDNPEIVVVAFVYNGNEGSTVAAPIVEKVLSAYFELKQIDAAAAETP